MAGRGDLYSLGVVFYQLLTGRHPFAAGDALGWVHAHVALMPAPPFELVAAIPKPVSEIVMRLLSKAAEVDLRSDRAQAGGAGAPREARDHPAAEGGNTGPDDAHHRGMAVTALHNHFFFDRPKVYFMHIGGEGNVDVLGKGVRAALDAARAIRKKSPRPRERFEGAPIPAPSAVDGAKVEAALGAKGTAKIGHLVRQEQVTSVIRSTGRDERDDHAL